MRSIKSYLILVLLFSVSNILNVSSSENDFLKCERIVKNWESSSLNKVIKDDTHILKDLLFFLHIPRTGGRTYFHCFLKKLYAGSLECPRSYDKLRFNPKKSNCNLLSTHDDYSMMSKLVSEKTSVVTILRDPLERVFSTYEFSIEVAARFLVHPNLTSATKMGVRLRSKTKGSSTLEIWPWKYLVPWMREDLFARRDTRMTQGQLNLQTIDPYNMEDIVMPLNNYIHDPIAREIIHNGATFQIAGLTNNSYLHESHEVRKCVLKYQTLGKYVLEVAKRRLDSMLYVGLTENHHESASMFVNVVGSQAISRFSINNTSEQKTSSQDPEIDTEYHGSNSTYQNQKPKKSPSIENITAGKLIGEYDKCITTLRKTQSERRINSLKRIAPANFTKEARGKVPESLIQEIRSLNSLDMELYKYAQAIFSKQRGQIVKNRVSVEKQEMEFMNSYDESTSSRKVLLIVPVFFFLIFILLFVNARRGTSKVKL